MAGWGGEGGVGEAEDTSLPPSQRADFNSARWGGTLALPSVTTVVVGQSSRRKVPPPMGPSPTCGRSPTRHLTSVQGLQAVQLAVVGRLVQRQPALLVGF